MAKKKMTKKKDSWDSLGKQLGKKIENDMKNKACEEKSCKICGSGNCGCKGFFGRALLAVGLLLILNSTGTLAGVNIWYQIIAGVGFAFLQF